MKRKIIRAFLAIYLVLSMAYSGIRAAYITVMAAIAPPDNVEEQIELASASFGIDTVPAEPERDSAELPPPVIQVEDVPEETVQPSEEAPAPSPEEAPAPDAAEEAPAEESALEEAPPEDDAEEISAYEEAPEASEDGEDDEEAYVEEAPAEDVPSLEEYLSTLHCGRCGRNCYLSNPRCRTGRNKAERETTAYYEMYGSSDEV